MGAFAARVVVAAVMLVVLAVGCEGGHGHEDEHAHEGEHGHAHEDEHGHEDEDEDEDDHGHEGDGYDHASEHPPGHDHHAAGHGHGGAAVRRVTRFGERSELFAEHPMAVAGQEVTWLAHVTFLEDFSPMEEGRLSIALQGPATIEGSSEEPLRPGIYQLSVAPPAPGTYRGAVHVEGAVEDRIEVQMEVYESAADAQAAAPEADHDGVIEFLKEQQWRMPFALEKVEEGEIQPTVQVQGSVETPPGGSAEVGAPLPGRIVAPPGGLPRPGEQVKAGQLLARLAPTPGSPEAAARAKLAVVEAQAREQNAQAAVDRAERLMADEAIPKRQLEEARRELKVAQEAVQAAREAEALFSSATTGRGKGSWRLTAPLDGTLVTVAAKPGAAVSPGDVLFTLVDTRELWLRARVPEQRAAQLDIERDPVYRVAGLQRWERLRLGGETPDASVVTVSPQVDPHTRTVDVIYALRDPDPGLRVGGLLTMGLPVGDVWRGLVVPSSAVIDDGGRQLVYVQLDGEHFEERAVRIGPRSGSQVGVSAGLQAGEHVVSRGANIVRLTARSASAPAHGHIH